MALWRCLWTMQEQLVMLLVVYVAVHPCHSALIASRKPSAGGDVSCHGLCGVDMIVSPDVKSAPDSDSDTAQGVIQRKSCSCAETCRHEGICCSDFESECYHAFGTGAGDLVRHHAEFTAEGETEGNAVHEDSNSVYRGRHLLSVNNTEEGSGSESTSTPNVMSSAGTPTPSPIAASPTVVMSASQATTSSSLNTMPQTTTSPTTAGPTSREQLERMVTASISFLFRGNVSVLNTSIWMDNFRGEIMKIWQDYLYHGTDEIAAMRRNFSSVELLTQTPFVHEMDPEGVLGLESEAIEMSFYIKFNNSPIINDNFPFILTWVQPVRTLIQERLRVDIQSVLPNVSDNVYMNILGTPRETPSVAPTDTVDVSARISTDYLLFELPAGLSILAVAILLGIVIGIYSRYRKKKAVAFPAPKSRGLQRGKAPLGTSDAYDVGFVYPGPAVSIIHDNPYSAEPVSSEVVPSAPPSADTNHAIVVSNTGVATARDSAIELTGPDSGHPVPAPRSFDSVRHLQHAPNTTPL